MKWDQIQSDWQHFQLQFKEKWTKFSDTDLITISGKRDELLNRLQSAYGFSKARADRELKEFIQHLAMKKKESKDHPTPKPHHEQTPSQHPPVM